MRRVMTEVLSQAGITDFGQASDGNEAVEAAASDTYDAVLMDWSMPNMSGLDAVKAIRSAGNQVPIVMVTAASEAVHVQEALEAGANSYIVKPFRNATIISRIQEALKESAPPEDSSEIPSSTPEASSETPPSSD
jgi:two-component system chemotaxis response regulator CheY